MCLKEVLKRLAPMISERRRGKIASVVASRTNSLAILLENLRNGANENAIVRSMDALGCPHLHTLQTDVTETESCSKIKKGKFPPRTDAGARSWVRIHHWSDTRECIAHLKAQHGYTVVSACPAAATPISDIDFDQKLLVAFGNESEGISEELAEMSDFRVSLPMCGFVDSYNISVAVALVLYQAYLHRIKTHVRITGWRARWHA